MTDFDPTVGHWPALVALRHLLTGGVVRSVDLVTGALRRIADVDTDVNAILAIDPTALDQAAACDRRIATGSTRALEGIPVLVKDNIDTAGLASTAGSTLLSGTPPLADADIVGLLRAAGAVVLGKTNLSEWSNFRRASATEGWSAVGGQTRNPHVLDHSPWGSSSGSAAAVAAGLAPVAIGTETDGSVVCPAAACGVIGCKPALGSLPTKGIVPISATQDTPGILARSVADAAYVLSALTGKPMPDLPADPAGLRIGVWPGSRPDAESRALLDRAADTLAAAGAQVVPVTIPMDRERLEGGVAAMVAEFAPSINDYLATRPGAPGDLAAVLVAYEQDPLGQDLMALAAAVTDQDRAAALVERARATEWATELLDDVLRGLDCVVAPTGPPAWPIDHAAGDPLVRTTSTVPALAGRPNISVPAGLVGDLPVGVSVFGPPDDTTALRMAAAVATCWPRVAPQFRPQCSINATRRNP